MKKILISVFLSLSFSGLFGYANLIVTLERGDKRAILIGDIHENKTFTLTEQEPFFKELISKLNKIEEEKPNTVVVYHEGAYGIEKLLSKNLSWQEKLSNFWQGVSLNPLLYTPETNLEKLITPEITEPHLNASQEERSNINKIPLIMQTLYSHSAYLHGPTLASFSFQNNHNFKIRNYDIREINENEELTLERCIAIYQSIINSILESSPHYEDSYEKSQLLINKYENRDDKSEEKELVPVKIKAAAMDLGLMEELASKEFQPHSIFLIHAGLAHIMFLKNLLQTEGWEIIDTIESSNPKNWVTSDPYLGKGLNLFPFHAKPIDAATQKRIESEIKEAIENTTND